MTFSEFAAEYCKGARQMRTDTTVSAWWAMGVSAAEATRWANLGYMPGEARREMDAGGTIDSIEQSERNADAARGRRAAGIWRDGRRIA